MIPNTAFAPKTVTLQGGAVGAAPAAAPAGLEVVFRPDPSVYDGRFANNALAAGAAEVADEADVGQRRAARRPATADAAEPRQRRRRRAEAGRPARCASRCGSRPGRRADTLTLHLGYGRTRAGRIGNGIGFNVNALRTTAAPDIADRRRSSTKTGDSYELASHAGPLVARRPQPRPRRDRRAVREGSRSSPQKQEHQPLDGLTMFRDCKYEGYAWGMAIDQNVCTGCNACVVACQAENNVPVVGKAQVLNGREMHWLRIDRYYTGDLDNPDTYHQPMPCQQCENGAVRGGVPGGGDDAQRRRPERHGLQPLRRHALLLEQLPVQGAPLQLPALSDWDTPSLKLQRNPDVTVRSRGVMEKCTYCVQRINQARVAAKLEDRQIRDGEVRDGVSVGVPDRGDRLRQHQRPEQPRCRSCKASPLNYALLAELNTRPRTTYLAVVRNPEHRAGTRPAARRRRRKDTRRWTSRTHRTACRPETSGAAAAHAGGHRARAHVRVGHRHDQPRRPDEAHADRLVPRVLHRVHAADGPEHDHRQPAADGHRHLGQQHPGRLGVRHHQLRLVDRYRPRRHADLGDSAALPPAVAHLDQPLRRGDDALRGGLRGDVPAAPHRPAVAGGLLAVPVSEHDGPVAAVPQPADLGRVRGLDLRHGVGAVLVHRPRARHGDAARSRASRRSRSAIYGMLALGWRGSARHWQRYETAYLLLAGISTPLVLSVHSVVSFDFAVSVLPGWHATIFPPYFVAGAIYSGFAMVMTLAIPLRKFYGLEDFITMRHIHNMTKVMLVTGMIVAYGYANEAFFAWYSAQPVRELHDDQPHDRARTRSSTGRSSRSTR